MGSCEFCQVDIKLSLLYKLTCDCLQVSERECGLKVDAAGMKRWHFMIVEAFLPLMTDALTVAHLHLLTHDFLMTGGGKFIPSICR